MRVWGFSVVGIAFFALMIIGVVVGTLIGGGTGTAITVTCAGVLAIAVIGKAGGFILLRQPPPGPPRIDPPPEDEGFRDSRRRR